MFQLIILIAQALIICLADERHFKMTLVFYNSDNSTFILLDCTVKRKYPSTHTTQIKKTLHIAIHRHEEFSNFYWMPWKKSKLK